jgi:hypothetical protein
MWVVAFVVVMAHKRKLVGRDALSKIDDMDVCGRCNNELHVYSQPIEAQEFVALK